MNVEMQFALAVAATATLLVAGCGQNGPQADAQAAAVAPPAGEANERVLFDFRDPNAGAAWRAVNDTVMGGVSRSALESADGAMAFAGVLSLENFGGFATVRSPAGSFDLAGFDGLAFRIRGDGKRYKAFAKTNRKDDGYLYQVDFDTQAGAWQELRLPFSRLRPHYRGARLAIWPGLKPGKIVSIGFMIADKQAGPFRLEVASIRAYQGG
jgi:NADH dehydrogenase [ubiquinone] 1 alpha subcomplex assembly factor 1